jgi:hypothetical protein
MLYAGGLRALRRWVEGSTPVGWTLRSTRWGASIRGRETDASRVRGPGPVRSFARDSPGAPPIACHAPFIRRCVNALGLSQEGLPDSSGSLVVRRELPAPPAAPGASIGVGGAQRGLYFSPYRSPRGNRDVRSQPQEPGNSATQDRFTYNGRPLVPVCTPATIPGCLSLDPTPETLPTWITSARFSARGSNDVACERVRSHVRTRRPRPRRRGHRLPRSVDVTSAPAAAVPNADQ